METNEKIDAAIKTFAALDKDEQLQAWYQVDWLTHGEVVTYLRKELRAVKILDAWRRRDPLVLQWVVGSRFARVSLTLQRQGCTLSVYLADTEAAARIAAADALAKDDPSLLEGLE